MDAASTVGLVAARLADVTFSFTNHTAYNPYLLTPKLRHGRLAVSISHYDRRLLARMAGGTGADRIRVLYQGIDLGAFPLRAPKDPGEQITESIRLDEITANVDALSGGYFTKQLKSRRLGGGI